MMSVRKALSAAVAAVTIMVMAGIAQPAVAQPAGTGTALLRDYFSSKNDPNWTFYNRYGGIHGGRLWIDGDYQPGSEGRDGWALTHVGDASWTNYAFRVIFDSSNTGGSPPQDHITTAYVRVAAESGNVRDTMYRVEVIDPGTNDPTGGEKWCGGGILRHGMVVLSKYVNGAGSYPKFVCRSNSVTGTNALRIQAENATITISINGSRVLRYTDPEPILSGGVGVGFVWELNGWFDNAIVRPLI